MKTIFNKLIIAAIASLAVLSSCEDVVKVDVPEGESQLAVDAFINDKRETQKIILTKTSPYFDNSAAPPATGAKVKVNDMFFGTEYTFTDDDNDGVYTWTPQPGDTLCRVFYQYKLTIEYNGETFESESYVGRPARFDSLGYEYRSPTIGDKGYFMNVYAYDREGRGDFYWLRAFKNGNLLNRPSAISTAVESAFSEDGVDGAQFIFPIREFLNSEPYNIGDSVSVEIYSVTPQTLIFLNQIAVELNNAGLFATPPANVPTNISTFRSTSKIKAVGWFNTSAVATKWRVLK